MLAQCGQAEVQSKSRGAPAELTGVRMSHVACRAPAVYEVPPGSCVWNGRGCPGAVTGPETRVLWKDERRRTWKGLEDTGQRGDGDRESFCSSAVLWPTTTLFL